MSNTYCVEADITKIFGASNVEKWADLDNTGVDATIDARWAAAIAAAGDEIDSWLRNTQYTIPLADEDAATPSIITSLAAEFAGVWLYEHAGALENHALEPVKSRVQQVLREIRDGTRQINAM